MPNSSPEKSEASSTNVEQIKTSLSSNPKRRGIALPTNINAVIATQATNSDNKTPTAHIIIGFKSDDANPNEPSPASVLAKNIDETNRQLGSKQVTTIDFEGELKEQFGEERLKESVQNAARRNEDVLIKLDSFDYLTAEIMNSIDENFRKEVTVIASPDMDSNSKFIQQAQFLKPKLQGTLKSPIPDNEIPNFGRADEVHLCTAEKDGDELKIVSKLDLDMNSDNESVFKNEKQVRPEVFEQLPEWSKEVYKRVECEREDKEYRSPEQIAKAESNINKAKDAFKKLTRKI